MMRISAANEPLEFDSEVRQPGMSFLEQDGSPKSSKAWAGHEYWRKAIPWLRNAYGEICAYSAHWIPSDTGASTVDHFVPLAVSELGAYEWLNFRLSSARLNSRKRTRLILDPFTIGDNWFQLSFPSISIIPNPDLSERGQVEVQRTIDILGLNDGICVSAREHWLIEYAICREKGFLARHAPFLHSELERQSLWDEVVTLYEQNGNDIL